MQVLLNSDHNIDAGQGMADHLETLVKDTLHRFGDHVTRVEAHLADVNGAARSGAEDIRCTLEARLAGSPALVVKHNAPTAHQAIDGAVRKLQRALASEVDKHASTRGPAAPLPDDAGDDADGA